MRGDEGLDALLQNLAHHAARLLIGPPHFLLPVSQSIGPFREVQSIPGAFPETEIRGHNSLVYWRMRNHVSRRRLPDAMAVSLDSVLREQSLHGTERREAGSHRETANVRQG